MGNESCRHLQLSLSQFFVMPCPPREYRFHTLQVFDRKLPYCIVMLNTLDPLQANFLYEVKSVWNQIA
nr:hypothetical protein KV8917_160091 [Klebsiella variicola]